MKLHNNQLYLIRHLIRFNYLDYESCLDVLDRDNTGDKIKMSYAFRPLTKNKYISKNKEGIVTVLKKGKALFPNTKPLISSGGEKERVIQVSKIAALLEKNGCTITDKVPNSPKPHFIPSACWRNIAHGILSTTRFVGMLLAYGKKYAVYDIGNGSIEWQVRAESSLFYTRYGSYETKADGMILICDDDKRDDIATNIIRQTMWHRKSLMSENYTERERPVRFSRSPIKLRTQYERVYLTTPKTLKKSLIRIYNEDNTIRKCLKNGVLTYDPKIGDFEIWPERFYINPAFDLLKLVYFFSAVKLDVYDENESGCKSGITYSVAMHKEDKPILDMYQDVKNSRRIKVYEIRSDENS